jgi:hypothetical protein
MVEEDALFKLKKKKHSLKSRSLKLTGRIFFLIVGTGVNIELKFCEFEDYFPFDWALLCAITWFLV